MPLRGRGTRRRDAARGAPRDRERLLVHVDRRGAAPLRRARAASASPSCTTTRPRSSSELTDDDLARALTPDYLERLARVQGRLARDRGEETWWRSRERPVRPRRRLLLRGVRARREPPDLLRRARRARRRLSEVGVGARRPARRASASSTAAATSGSSSTRATARSSTTRRPTRAGCRSSSCRWLPWSSSRTTAASSSRCGSASGACGSAARPLYLLDTQVDGNPDWARDHRHALRRRPGEPAAAGDPARRRRRPRAARARARADGLPHERGPLRVPPARAHARARGGAGPVARTRRSSGSAPRRSSRRTRRCRRGTRCSIRSSCERTSAGSSSAAASAGTSSSRSAGPGRARTDSG